ncbi:MAG: hypothetical protein IJR47_03325 [Clostridia bacterium]|nr:hypothetical protein [Clostridia bacterium]
MENIERSIIYLRGLIDGAGYEEDSKEGLIFNAIADSLENILDELEMQSCCCNDMIDELLDDELEDYDDCFNEDDFVETICPNCNEVILFDKETYNKGIDLICPNCNGELKKTE